MLLLGLTLLVTRAIFSPPAWQRLAPGTVSSVLTQELVARSQFPPTESVQCRACHEAEFEDWKRSQHAQANRLVAAAFDTSAFEPLRTFELGGLKTTASKEGDAFLVGQTSPGKAKSVHPAAAVIGVTPLVQYLTPFPGGRLQVIDPAYDPAKGDWFSIFPGDERLPHEWGFWKNRGLNWNSQCAACHMTGFQKNYDIATDAYRSTWRAMGISCSQCHGSMEEHLKNPGAPVVKMSDRQVASNCASCHSRREEITGTFKPGDDFDDHYRVTLPDRTDTYYADGQVRDEDFEYASFIGSRMGHAGVKCIDCHNPHSGKLRLPVENNRMCMSCHTPPGAMGAIPIPDVAAHSHHAIGSTGNRCVECHMPQTTYMARDSRRDHGFTIPDPLLTIEHNIPNACNRCHSDQSAEWAAQWVEKWYGEKMQRPARERARLMARARKGDRAAFDQIPGFVRKEPIAAWRASLISLLGGQTLDAARIAFLGESARDESPLVRSAALSALAASEEAGLYLLRGTTDPKRMVRVTAAWALLQRRETLEYPQRAEVATWLDNQSDQPLGAVHQAELAMAEGRKADVARWLQKATKWDPSAGMFETAAHGYYFIGDLEDSRREFLRAIQLDKNNASATYSLALLEAECSHPDEALRLLRCTVEINPDFGRAWYNLGLAQSAAGDLAAARASLGRAEDLLPDDPAPPYALATVLLQSGDQAGALSAASRALKIDPSLQPAREMIRSLEGSTKAR